MSCEPCKNTECLGLPEQEYEALKELYQRIIDTRGYNTDDKYENDESNREHCKSRNSDHGDIFNSNNVDKCSYENSVLKLFDQNLTALLKQREGKTAEHGMSQNQFNKLPSFKSCKHKSGAINATSFGLDIEQEMSNFRVVNQNDVKRAAYELVMAEAYCKHAGAVEAAEIAMYFEPIDSLAEDAARIGAQNFTTVANIDQIGDTDTTDCPIEVVAYVGNTCPEKDVN